MNDKVFKKSLDLIFLQRMWKMLVTGVTLEGTWFFIRAPTITRKSFFEILVIG